MQGLKLSYSCKESEVQLPALSYLVAPACSGLLVVPRGCSKRQGLPATPVAGLRLEWVQQHEQQPLWDLGTRGVFGGGVSQSSISLPGSSRVCSVKTLLSTVIAICWPEGSQLSHARPLVQLTNLNSW